MDPVIKVTALFGVIPLCSFVGLVQVCGEYCNSSLGLVWGGLVGLFVFCIVFPSLVSV